MQASVTWEAMLGYAFAKIEKAWSAHTWAIQVILNLNKVSQLSHLGMASLSISSMLSITLFMKFQGVEYLIKVNWWIFFRFFMPSFIAFLECLVWFGPISTPNKWDSCWRFAVWDTSSIEYSIKHRKILWLSIIHYCVLCISIIFYFTHWIQVWLLMFITITRASCGTHRTINHGFRVIIKHICVFC